MGVSGATGGHRGAWGHAHPQARLRGSRDAGLTEKCPVHNAFAWSHEAARLTISDHKMYISTLSLMTWGDRQWFAGSWGASSGPCSACRRPLPFDDAEELSFLGTVVSTGKRFVTQRRNSSGSVMGGLFILALLLILFLIGVVRGYRGEPIEVRGRTDDGSVPRLRDIGQAWKAERTQVAGQAIRTRRACILAGLALFLAAQAYVALERERGLFPWVVSQFAEDGTWIFHLHPGLRNPQVWPKVRQNYASAYYWPAVQVLAYFAYMGAGIAVWQGVRLFRAAWPRTWNTIARFVNQA